MSVPTTGAVSPVGLPAAAGGVDLSGGIVSVQPGIRKLKKIAVTAQLPAGYHGGLVRLDLPKSSYLHKAVVRITGTLRSSQGTGLATVTAGDPRNFVSKLEFALSGSTSPRVLSGLQEDIIDNLDVPAVSCNKQTFSANTGAVSTNTDTPFELWLSPMFVVSAQNLYGIPYLGALATVPQILLTLTDPAVSLAPGTGGTGYTSTFENGLIKLELWRIDLPGPVAPQKIVNYVDGKPVEQMIPGQGLYLESSYVLISRMFNSQPISGPSGVVNFRLPIGPDYLRIIILAYQNNALDPETNPMIDHIDLVVQQATSLESKEIWQFDAEYRRLYNKLRPTGVYVFTGIDESGTDSDLYVTRELGNFDVNVYQTTNTPAANSRIEVLVQELVPLSAPGQYL